MKKILAIVTCFVMIFMTIQPVAAAGVSTSTRSLKIVKGSSATFTITASDAAGRIDISTSNSAVAKINKTSAWLDKSSTSVTVTGVSDGGATIYVRLSDVSGYDGKQLSGIIAVNVNVYTPVYEPSSVATLASITIPDISLEEEFSPNRKEYTAYLPNEMQNPKITASTSHSKAKVSSINNNLHEGWNELTITCTAEDGKTKMDYKLKLYVEETPTEIIEYKGVSLGVVKNLDKVKLEGFEKVDGLFVNPSYKMLYMMDMSSKEKSFYVVDENRKIMAKYLPIEVGSQDYIPFDASENDFDLGSTLVKDSLDFAGEQIVVWNYSDESLSNYCVVELMNEEGEKELFTFDKEMKTLQRYFELPKDNKLDIYKAATFSLAGFSAVLLIALVVLKIPKKVKN